MVKVCVYRGKKCGRNVKRCLRIWAVFLWFCGEGMFYSIKAGEFFCDVCRWWIVYW